VCVETSGGLSTVYSWPVSESTRRTRSCSTTSGTHWKERRTSPRLWDIFNKLLRTYFVYHCVCWLRVKQFQLDVNTPCVSVIWPLALPDFPRGYLSDPKLKGDMQRFFLPNWFKV